MFRRNMSNAGRKLAPKPGVPSLMNVIGLVPVAQKFMLLDKSGQLFEVRSPQIVALPLNQDGITDRNVKILPKPPPASDSSGRSSAGLSPVGSGNGQSDVMLSTAQTGDSSSSNGSFSVVNASGTASEDGDKMSTGFRESTLRISPPRASKTGKCGKNLECPFCGKEFRRSFPYTVHLRQHTGQKPYQCMICGRAFSQNSNVKKHIESHKAAKPADRGPVAPPDHNPESVIGFIQSTATFLLQRKCPYCAQLQDSTGDLKKHVVAEHKKEKKFQCRLRSCRILFADLSSLLRHLKEHEGTLLYHCPHCEKEYLSLKDVGVHQHTHIFDGVKKQQKLYNRAYQCFACGEQYRSLENLERHQSHVNHVYPCCFVGCGKSYPTRRRLRRHLTTHYPLQFKFQCHLCSKKFPYHSSLKTHFLTHGTESHVCSVCGKTFRRKDVLQRHILTSHRNYQSFICTFGGCGRSFKRKDHLKEHILIHSRPAKNFICGSCGKVFKRKRWLCRHEAADHAGDPLFKRETSDFQGNEMDALSIHLGKFTEKTSSISTGQK